jgi:hypothetical protein
MDRAKCQADEVGLFADCVGPACVGERELADRRGTLTQLVTATRRLGYSDASPDGGPQRSLGIAESPEL